MRQPPRFSILICNFNYGNFVGQALRSALDQNYAGLFEVIVVDDGSTDHSRAVIESFLGNARVRAVFQENRGQSGAFEAGVRVATGDYVCLLDSDDLFLPDKLTRVAQKIAELDVPLGELFLCHDLQVQDMVEGNKVERTWFDMISMAPGTQRYTLENPAHSFPFSIPAGLVLSRTLMARIMEALPCWAFPRGTDGVLCPAALLYTGQVHYLQDVLGVYRIHGDNEFAGLEDGRYAPKFNPAPRAPKTLHFLNQWLDTLDQTPARRTLSLDYLRRLEHHVRRLSATRQLQEPSVSVGLLGDWHGLPADLGPSASLQSHSSVHFVEMDAANLPELEQMARAYEASNGEYIVYLRAGDRLDREFAERHLASRQRGALVGVSCSDVRLASAQGSLVHADLFRRSGAWKEPLQYIAPLTTSLTEWVAPPLSACLFRRNAILDRLFANRTTMPATLQQAGFWLVFQLQLHTAGALRMQETLGTCRLPDGAAAHYGYLSGPTDLHGKVLQPPVADTVAWLQDFYGREESVFRDWLSPAWHQRFVQWLPTQAT
jgi:hypothetical protein